MAVDPVVLREVLHLDSDERALDRSVRLACHQHVDVRLERVTELLYGVFRRDRRSSVAADRLPPVELFDRPLTLSRVETLCECLDDGPFTRRGVCVVFDRLVRIVGQDGPKGLAWVWHRSVVPRDRVSINPTLVKPVETLQSGVCETVVRVRRSLARTGSGGSAVGTRETGQSTVWGLVARLTTSRGATRYLVTSLHTFEPEGSGTSPLKPDQ